MDNFQPSQARSRLVNWRSRLGGLVLLSRKRKQILQGISQGGEISAITASPTRKPGLLLCTHHLSQVQKLISNSQLKHQGKSLPCHVFKSDENITFFFS